MRREEIITGLDIGSSTIRIAVGQKAGPDSPLKIIGAAEAPAEGIKRGVINSVEDAISSISTCLEKAERMVGLPLEHAWVGISGHDIVSEESKGVVVISNPEGEIQEGDVERAIEAARAIASPPNYEVLHVIAKSFKIDDQAGIKDPVGMTGIRLEATVQIIQGPSSQIKNLTKAIYRTSLDIDDLILSILSASEAVLNNRQKDLGVILINLGAFTTSLVVFEENEVVHTAVLPIGAGHITNDIAIGLRISLDTAERLKLEYGQALAKDINKRDELDLKELGGVEEGLVSKKHIAEIVEARVEEIFSKIDKELKKIGRAGSLPAGAVLIGGGAKLPGLVELAKQSLRLPVALGEIIKLSTIIDKINDLSFVNAVGLVLWGEQMQKQGGGKMKKMISRFGSIDDAMGTMKKWFKKFGS
ncbi:MAG: cell division protein FtsA [bacterium]